MDINNRFKELVEDSDGVVAHGLPKVGPMDGWASADDEQYAPYEINNPEFLDRLNGFLGTMSCRPYFNPHAAINHLKNKLTVTGLDFESPRFVGDSGTVRNALKQWGNPTNFTLVIHWAKHRGWFTLEPCIEPNAASEEIVVSEEKPVTDAKAMMGQKGSAIRRPVGALYTNNQGMEGRGIHTKALRVFTFANFDPRTIDPVAKKQPQSFLTQPQQ